ncbi:unnamed protein product [Fraxinus pennsylvanica]|uniref:Legume lectin domain-containing protein n=1 Tax=Fraxinus pennsylvanica TaxID=56036 RepID=A0AAD2DSE4_9LAMI|nr:unnamed protein product [Fraxinus pennsylvanica]
MRQILLCLESAVTLPELSSLRISGAGITFAHGEGFDEFIMSRPSSVSKAFTYSSSVADSLLSEIELEIRDGDDGRLGGGNFDKGVLEFLYGFDKGDGNFDEFLELCRRQRQFIFLLQPYLESSLDKPEYPGLSGHGIAFVLAPTRGLPGAFGSQYLGLFNSTNNGNSSNHVFAVELDTILNDEFLDINSNHVGIDINGPGFLPDESAAGGASE